MKSSPTRSTAESDAPIRAAAFASDTANVTLQLALPTPGLNVLSILADSNAVAMDVRERLR